MAPPIRLRGDEYAYSGKTPRWLLADSDEEEEKCSPRAAGANFRRPPQVAIAGMSRQVSADTVAIELETANEESRKPILSRIQSGRKDDLVDVNLFINEVMNASEGDASVALLSVSQSDCLPANKMFTLVERLLEMGADVSKVGVDDRTALHHVAQKTGYEAVAYILLEREKTTVGRRDEKNKTPLDLAIENKLCRMATMLIEYTDKAIIREKFSTDCQFFDLIEKLHRSSLQRHTQRRHKEAANQAILVVLDSFWEEPDTEEGKAKAHFTALNKKKNGKTAYTLLTELGVSDYLNHDVVKELTRHKWQQIRHFYWLTLALNIGGVVLLTAAAILAIHSANPSVYEGPADTARAVIEFIIAMLTLFVLVQNICQWKRNRRNYFFDPWNYIEMGIVLLTFTLIILRFMDSKFQWVVYSFLYLISVFRLVKFFATSKYLLTYIRTTMKMWKEIFAFMLLWVVTLVACVGAFAVGYRVHERMPVSNQPSIDNSDRNGTRLGQLQQLLITSSQLFIDENHGEKLAEAYRLGKIDRLYPTIMLLALTFVTTVILLNVLIAQLSDKFRVAKIKGRRAAWNNIAWIISEYEKRYFCFKLPIEEIPCKKVSRKMTSAEKFSEFKALNNRIDGLHDTLNKMKRADCKRDKAVKDTGCRFDQAIEDLVKKTEHVEMTIGNKLAKIEEDAGTHSLASSHQLKQMMEGIQRSLKNLETKLGETANVVEQIKLLQELQSSANDDQKM